MRLCPPAATSPNTLKSLTDEYSRFAGTDNPYLVEYNDDVCGMVVRLTNNEVGSFEANEVGKTDFC